MSKSLFFALLSIFYAASYSQTVTTVTPTSTAGSQYTGADSVYFGTAASLTLGTAATDTSSNWINLVHGRNAPVPSTFFLNYRSKATDSSSSIFSFHFDTRWCFDPQNSLQCDSAVTYAGQHYSNSTTVALDTLLGRSTSGTYKQFSGSLTGLAGGFNQLRLTAHRVSIASGKTVTVSNIFLPQK